MKRRAASCCSENASCNTRSRKAHYAEHVEKPFYPSLESFITAAPVVAAIYEGLDVVRVVREMLGATSGLKAAAGTIRGDFSASRQMNLVHASDSAESATREIGIYFDKTEIIAWEPRCNDMLRARMSPSFPPHF